MTGLQIWIIFKNASVNILQTECRDTQGYARGKLDEEHIEGEEDVWVTESDAWWTAEITGISPSVSHVVISSEISCYNITNHHHKSSWTPSSRTQKLDGTTARTWSWDTAASLCWWASASLIYTDVWSITCFHQQLWAFKQNESDMND